MSKNIKIFRETRGMLKTFQYPVFARSPALGLVEKARDLSIRIRRKRRGYYFIVIN